MTVESRLNNSYLKFIILDLKDSVFSRLSELDQTATDVPTTEYVNT